MEGLNVKVTSLRKEVREDSQQINNKEELLNKQQIRINNLEAKNSERKRKMSNRVSSTDIEYNAPGKSITQHTSHKALVPDKVLMPEKVLVP